MARVVLLTLLSAALAAKSYAIDLFSCSPTSIEFTLDLSGSCNDNTVNGSPGTAGSSSFLGTVQEAELEVAAAAAAEEETNAAPDAMYHELAWGDIPDGIRAAYVVLGYDEAYWNGEGEDPAASAMAWMELTAEEQEAATILGHNESSWCSSDNPTCGNEFEHFLTPDLEAGYADHIKFEGDEVVAHDYAARVGIPGRSNLCRVSTDNEVE